MNNSFSAKCHKQNSLFCQTVRILHLTFRQLSWQIPVQQVILPSPGYVTTLQSLILSRPLIFFKIIVLSQVSQYRLLAHNNITFPSLKLIEG